MSKLIHLPNIDRELEQKLHSSGIISPEILRDRGSRNIFFHLKELDSSVCFETLLALEGAIKGVLIEELGENTREDLKLFMEIFNR